MEDAIVSLDVFMFCVNNGFKITHHVIMKILHNKAFQITKNIIILYINHIKTQKLIEDTIYFNIIARNWNALILYRIQAGMYLLNYAT